MDSTNNAKSEYEKAMDQELQQLAEYRLALEAEFRDAPPDDEETANKARKRVIELVPDAGAQIRMLINHADSEAIRKDLSKWVFQVAMKHAEETGEHDEVRRLLKSITGLDEN